MRDDGFIMFMLAGVLIAMLLASYAAYNDGFREGYCAGHDGVWTGHDCIVGGHEIPRYSGKTP